MASPSSDLKTSKMLKRMGECGGLSMQRLNSQIHPLLLLRSFTRRAWKEEADPSSPQDSPEFCFLRIWNMTSSLISPRRQPRLPSVCLRTWGQNQMGKKVRWKRGGSTEGWARLEREQGLTGGKSQEKEPAQPHWSWEMETLGASLESPPRTGWGRRQGKSGHWLLHLPIRANQRKVAWGGS